MECMKQMPLRNSRSLKYPGEKRRSYRRSRSRYSEVAYSAIGAVMMVVAAIIYKNYITKCRIEGRQLLVFYTLIIGSWLILWFTSVLKDRNRINLITGTILPLLIHSTYRFSGTYTSVKICMIAGIVLSTVISVVMGLIIAGDEGSIYAKKSVLFIVFMYVFRITCCVILFGVCIFGRILVSKTWSAIIDNENNYVKSVEIEGIPDYENSLAANIQTVSHLDPKGGWDELSVEEKMEILKTAKRIECRYLGMTDSMPSLELAYLSENVLGEYYNEEDTVVLSYDYVNNNAGGYDVLNVLCHEIYHRYQHRLVDLYRTLKNDDEMSMYADLDLFYRSSIYEKEFSDYCSGTGGSEVSYYLYSRQAVEEDANAYALESVKQFYDAIQGYFDEIN